jgi:hypothetical protein
MGDGDHDEDDDRCGDGDPAGGFEPSSVSCELLAIVLRSSRRRLPFGGLSTAR